jgi:hypothetical protein
MSSIESIAVGNLSDVAVGYAPAAHCCVARPCSAGVKPLIATFPRKPGTPTK